MTNQSDPPVTEHVASATATASGGGSATEWAVAFDWTGRLSLIGPISKQTPQRIYHPAPHNAKREAFTDLSAVIYRGPEAVCAKLGEQIKSSRALSEQEQRASRARHEERVKGLVAKATGASQ